jgi:GT2 family glycosyltransferase
MNELVAIIVLNRNQEGYTRDCLASLLQADYPRFRILVVDNGSADDSLQRVAEEFPAVNFLWLKDNRGVAGGRNAGLHDSLQWQPEYVLFLDNDTVVAPDLLTRLVTRLKADPGIGAVQPKIYFADSPRKICSVGGKLYPRISHYRHPSSGQIDSGQIQEAASVDWLSGCATLVRAKAFHEIGLLDETYSPYCHEDVDLSMRLRKSGYRLMVEPAAVVWHRVSSLARLNHDKLRNQAKGHILFLRFHTKFFDLPFSIAWISFHMARRYLFPALVRRDWASAAGVFRGIWEGLEQERLPLKLVSNSSQTTAASSITGGASARSRKKVLLLGVLGPFDSGPTRVYETLLKSHFTERYEVRFLDLQFARDVADFEYLRPRKFYRLLSYLLRTTYWLFRESYDAVCVPLATNRNAFLKDSLFVWLAVLFGLPVVILEHGTGIPALYQRSGVVVRWFMRSTLCCATRFIVLADRLKFNFEPFVPVERIQSVHLGIPPLAANGQPRRERDKAERLRVLYLSTLLESKGLLVLFQSLPKILAVRNNFKCVIAGGWGRDSESLKKRITQFIEANHLQEVVNFAGPVECEAKAVLFRDADIFAFPTLVDSYGIVTLEAMAAGTPIVATSVGAIPEIVMDGINGLICETGNPEDLAEKILYLAERPALRQQMRQNNVERYEKFFTARKFASRMIDAFESVIAEAHGER